EFRQLRAWLNNLQARPAWQRAIEKGGPLEIPGG
ncbi:glutathione S-transferase, partial [Cronobacter muytjensii]